MTTCPFRAWLGSAAVGAALLLGPGAMSAADGDSAGLNRPQIERIALDAHAVVVTVAVPPGVKKVTLESRPRLDAGAWTPRVVQRLDGQGGQLEFRLVRSAAFEVLRVRGDAEEPLPTRFYAGPSAFNGQVTEGVAEVPPGGDLRAQDAVGAPEAAPGGGQRDVVESDIWVLRGDTLFFFNQYRGLQVIRVADPDRPEVTGTLSLPAAGEQMYVLDERHVVLLARAGCTWGTEQGSQILVVEVDGGTPRLVRALPVAGFVQESRLVGTALYVASQTYRRVPAGPRPDEPKDPDARTDGDVRVGTELVNETWEYGTQVAAFDLADPAAPVARNTLWYPGYGHVVAATDRFLFVGQQAGNDWWRSVIQIIDISSPDGELRPVATLLPAGRVADKFKLNLNGDVFTVITHVWRWQDREETVSVLETFSLASPTDPRKLGEIRVGRGEALFATRFDGDRAYLVTFERVDPLWIVDLRDPTRPQLLGELEVPGWSTYIHPLGDRLVTVGIADEARWQVAVSLFDVRDPAQPSLLAKVPLGENYSWSEANADEKAFTVLPEAGLILVPYQGDIQGGYASRVQLIDLGADTLTARGVIEHTLQPRRATLHRDRILSLSGRELLTVDATDRDDPEVTQVTELAWPVDQVFVAGDYLIEIERGQTWSGQPAPSVRVVAAADPERVRAHLALPEPAAVVGATLAGEHLYLLQARNTSWIPVLPPEAEGAGDPPAPTPNLFLTVLNLGKLPAIEVSGRTEATLENLGWLNQLEAFVTRPGVVVWAGGSTGWWRGPWLWDVAVGGRWWAPWWGGSGGGQFFAFEVSDPTAPRLASFTALTEDADAWGFSRTCQAGELLYLSHQRSTFIERWQPPGASPDQARGEWVTRHYLSVVDFTDPAVPTIRPPVNLPGQLTALTHDGAVLYTTGVRYDGQGKTDGAQYLDVLAYDGVEASLIHSQKLGAEGLGQVVTRQDHLVLARYDAVQLSTSLETWRLTDLGVLVRLSMVKAPSYPNRLVLAGSLLLFSSGQAVNLYDATDPAALVWLGSVVPDGCLYPDLDAGVAVRDRQVFLPLGDYGVLSITLP